VFEGDVPHMLLTLRRNVFEKEIMSLREACSIIPHHATMILHLACALHCKEFHYPALDWLALI
jgi:hypothetical protein